MAGSVADIRPGYTESAHQVAIAETAQILRVEPSSRMEQFTPGFRLRIAKILDLDPGRPTVQLTKGTLLRLGDNPLHVPLTDHLE